MRNKEILIGSGILIILLALAGTGSAHSVYGTNCGFCHSGVPTPLTENGIFFEENHKFDGLTEPLTAASCAECHTNLATVFLPLTSNGSFYNSTHRYNDTRLAATMLTPPACGNCHADAAGGNFAILTGAPTYLKSTICENCHKLKYDDWQGTMHRVMLTSNITAQAMGLPTPTGLSWENMSYVIVGKQELRYLNKSGYLFMKYSAENKTFGPYNSSDPGNQPQYSCGRCHTTGYNANGGNQSGLPGIVGTWSEPGIACEKCHGPGGNGHQVEANVSEYVCLQCHNGSTRQGQFLSSAHSPPLKAPVSCLRCHSPFDYARNRTVTSTTAINVVCANCHNSHNTSDNKYRALFSPGGFNQDAYANAIDAKNSFFNSTASRLLLTGAPTGTLTTGKDVYDTLTTPSLIPSDIVDESYGGPIEVTGPISEVLCSYCHYEHGLSHIAGVNLTHARLNYPGLGLKPATCTDCHMSGNLKSHSFNVKDENNFPSRTCSRGTECHVTSDQNLNHSRFSVVPVVNEWKKSAHNDKEIGVNKSNPNSSFYFSRNGTTGNVTIRSRPNSCNKCHSPIDWNPATDSNTTSVQLPADFKGITCAICHNIHDMGDWLKKTGKAYGWYNRDAIPVKNTTTGAITRYKANYSMMANTTELCGNCHSNDNPRIYRAGPGWNQTTDTTPISPHGWPAKDIFVGSWKQTTLNFECISCHMATKVTDPTNFTEIVLPDSKKVTGHSFKVNVPLLQNDTCKNCHPAGDISTRIEVIQADTREKWNATNITVMDALATINAFTGPKDQSRDLIARAYWNLRMVSSDESWGVHNPVKVNNLLNESSTLANDALAALGSEGNLSITSFSPTTSTVIDVLGGPTRTFSITINQVANVSWQINGTEVVNETGVTTSSYPNSSATAGTWNITAAAGNPNGTAVQTWIWIVESAAPPTQFIANLSGSEEVPPVDTQAQGQAIFTLNPDSLHFNLVVSNITNATVSHIHLAPPGVNGPIVVTLYPGPTIAGGFDGVLAEGDITAENLTGLLAGMPLSALIDNMTAGNAYVNVHTVQNPGGEIRGQIKTEVPGLTTITVSPATALLAVNGTQMFTATAMQDGIPMANISISWASDNTTVGNVNPADAVTNESGMATTIFTASAEGTAMVTATNDTAAGSANVTVAQPTGAVTSFVLTPDTAIKLKDTTINIDIMALNDTMSQPLFNGMANITIAANNMSAVNAPMNVIFTNGNATIQVTSSIAQFVTVTATDGTITGNTTVQFADFVIPLVKGWNLVSIPSLADPSDVASALQLVQNNGVQTFDPATMMFTTPTDLQPLFGYWINVTADDQKLGFIADTSIIMVPPTRNLYEGWNLIGISASSSDAVDGIRLDMTPRETFIDLRNGDRAPQWMYSRLVSFDEVTGGFTTYTADVDLTLDLPPLKQGHGYWLFIKSIPNTDKNNVPWAGKLW